MGCLDELLVAAAYHPAGNAGADQAITSVAELLQAATRLSEASYTAPGWVPPLPQRQERTSNRAGSFNSKLLDRNTHRR